MKHPIQFKQPRFHPGLEWEAKFLSNEFIDLTRMALDNSYTNKSAAPLSKRRNGQGPTNGKTPGLFGIGATHNKISSPRKAFFTGGIIAAGTYATIDYFTKKPNQSQFRKMIKRSPTTLVMGVAAFSLFAPTS